MLATTQQQQSHCSLGSPDLDSVTEDQAPYSTVACPLGARFHMNGVKRTVFQFLFIIEPACNCTV
jgi:hypothetical protein